jgi:hypothetical protein
MGAQFSHPNLNHYRDGGMGGVGEDHSVVGYVPTHLLAAMPGNRTSEDNMAYQRDALAPETGTGFRDPVIVEFDGKTQRAYVGEGNHRVRAAQEAGLSHVPTRVIRSRIEDYTVKRVKEQGGRVAPTATGPSPWKGGMGEEYWPSDMHPKYVWPGEDVR